MKPNVEIEFVGVTKEFRTGLVRKKTALASVSFSIERGDVVGILGANGSGKSTSLKLILGFLKPTGGLISIGGQSPKDYRCRRLIGYLPENPRFQKFLTAESLLSYYGKLADITGPALRKRIHFLMDLVGIRFAAGERVGGFSKGMVQRLAIAQALIHDPRILIFDEPMSGLDPVGRRDIRELLLDIRNRMSVTVVFSSHILSDVEQVCQSVILLKNGQLTKQCSVAELLAKEPEQFRLVATTTPTELQVKFGQFLEKRNDGQCVFNVRGAQELGGIVGELDRHGVRIVSLESSRTTLEDSLFRNLVPGLSGGGALGKGSAESGGEMADGTGGGNLL